jgi:hypothetical protein
MRDKERLGETRRDKDRLGETRRDKERLGETRRDKERLGEKRGVLVKFEKKEIMAQSWIVSSISISILFFYIKER